MDKIIINGKEFITMVAISEEEQEKGLMYVSWPPPIMTFPFKKADFHKFWMKNTICPLDIIFCMAGKIVDICSGKPQDLTFLGPDAKVDMVVEMPAGTTNKCDIKIGNSIDIKYSINTLAKKFSQYV